MAFERRERHVLPGYTGHMPGSKHALGERYGVISNNFLNGQAHTQPRGRPVETVNYREAASKSSQPSQPHYGPGYTGHIPTAKSNIGDRFGTVTHQFCLNRAQSPQRISQSQTLEFFEDTEEQPRSIPGYSGFVPHARAYIGLSEGATLKKSVREVKATLNRSQSASHTEIFNVEEYPASIPLVFNPVPEREYVEDLGDITQRLYSKKTGIMNGYTGHVPQSKHLSVGHSFSQTSKLAARQIQAGVPPKEWTVYDTHDPIPRNTYSMGRPASAPVSFPTFSSQKSRSRTAGQPFKYGSEAGDSLRVPTSATVSKPVPRANGNWVVP